jgi:hypothetical protein
LYTFFDDKVKQFLEVTVQRQLNNADEQLTAEIESMVRSIPTYHAIVIDYCSHQLRAKVQFWAIKEVKENWLIDDPTRMLIVIDHKQKVLPMRYREGQVEYFGKKGMSLLGTMIVQANTGGNNDDEPAVDYCFVDFVIKGYSAQDHVQVAATLRCILHRIAMVKPATKEITLQSDNASCFASQELIPFIYHGNKTVNRPKVVCWLYTEAQTGRGRLDTHFL